MSFNKTVLVTGAGSGIGLALARAFAREGARVLVHDVRDASSLAEELGGEFLRANLAREEEVEALGREGAKRGVDILVNNAGFQHIAPVEEFPLETWQRMLQVMLTAPFQLTRALLPGMKAKGFGRILNIASVHGLVASPFKSAYIAAKHGLIGLTKTVALEAGPYGVTVNAIAPAYVRTPLVEGQIADQAKTLGIPEEEVVEKVFLAQAAIRRLIEPEEVAELALFLASDKASAITGAVFPIDLGWTAR
ncbi:D-beta-hydroxybutyrate dehydrogenase [Thermus scotoductus]|uniref:D-beta-hydroxybutyrate dehydrogenase n=2 Tax=Thermus scotoductus TaxID=37636 RepID=A0A430V583_THESC|nr:3-hydroxybutyrate dehydrogenase [Thermus scotoductus]RTG98996.1 D-beta-hydroxybutyrate dehydrogenase [Thermus scotoductus]RTH27035.1 D-beta-hydroxybutyrate dehydrogenase [Thermus scotoductus]RTI01294.1 D-beta-hydroxybutyrate dehydrogenase [Thermus scotoductus]RTI18965.1 D-beta-hydroxybutyrate dehydrogenase [Thermus scotoductus]RTI40860.1 D-beta-hydroxybutyrate dehydrogenase [Thermus scotoductus]